VLGGREIVRGELSGEYVKVYVKVKEGHTPKERRRGAYLPFTGR